MLKVGIVGVGGMGNIHLQNWRKMSDVQLVAICDKRLELAQQRSNGERCYATLEDMLSHETLDILDVCTPTDCHKEHSTLAMNAGIHVLCEKPIALSVSDAQVMFDAAEENHVKFMVAQVVRFAEDSQWIAKLCQNGDYGDIVHAHFWRLSPTPKWSSDNWMLDEQRSGGVPFDLHVHDVDYMVSLLGKPEAVEAIRTKPENGTYPDYYNARYLYPHAAVTIEAAWYDGAYPFQSGYRIMMQKAVIENLGGALSVYYNDGTTSVINRSTSAEDTGINLKVIDGYLEEQTYFKDCVLHNQDITFIKKQELLDVVDIISTGIRTAKINRC